MFHDTNAYITIHFLFLQPSYSCVVEYNQYDTKLLCFTITWLRGMQFYSIIIEGWT